MPVTLKLGQSVVYSLQEVDASGNPISPAVSFDAPPTWKTTSPTIASVTPSADGTTCTVAAVAPGSTTVEADASVNGGDVFGTDVVTVENNVAALKLIAGTPS